MANTRARIVLNLVMNDREQIMLDAIMMILQMMNNLAALRVGFIPTESLRRAPLAARQQLRRCYFTETQPTEWQRIGN
jgi:hypothetical protein